jgi:hypothetical protein
MTPEQWRKQQAKEREDKAKKNFGAFGPQSFRSRSLQSFQTELEKGKAGHLMPVMFAKKLVKEGKLKPEDVPYMQRGGAWDDSDVKGAKKKDWNDVDKRYSATQAASAFRLNVDWTGQQKRSGGPAASRAAAANKKKEEPPKKKMFGLF